MSQVFDLQLVFEIPEGLHNPGRLASAVHGAMWELGVGSARVGAGRTGRLAVEFSSEGAPAIPKAVSGVLSVLPREAALLEANLGVV